MATRLNKRPCHKKGLTQNVPSLLQGAPTYKRSDAPLKRKLLYEFELDYFHLCYLSVIGDC